MQNEDILVVMQKDLERALKAPEKNRRWAMLIDLRKKFPELTGKVAEKALVAADITVNKNMVPFDSRSAFQTSGIRVGTPAITTRGAKEPLMAEIVELIDTVLAAPECDKTITAVREKVNGIMKEYPIFAW